MLGQGLIAGSRDQTILRDAADPTRPFDEERRRAFNEFAAAGYESPTVTCVSNNREIDISAFNKFLRTKGMVISNGYGDLKNKTFRIAHMGDVTDADMTALLAAMEEFLVEQN